MSKIYNTSKWLKELSIVQTNTIHIRILNLKQVTVFAGNTSQISGILTDYHNWSKLRLNDTGLSLLPASEVEVISSYVYIKQLEDFDTIYINLIESNIEIEQQRYLIDKILEHNSNIQLIIYTNSPFIIQGLNPRKIDLSIYKVDIAVTLHLRRELNLYCMDIETINKLLFSINTYPEPINSKIEKYNYLLERIKNNEGKDSPELFTRLEKIHRKLEQDLDSAHPVLLRGQMITLLKK